MFRVGRKFAQHVYPVVRRSPIPPDASILGQVSWDGPLKQFFLTDNENLDPLPILRNGAVSPPVDVALNDEISFGGPLAGTWVEVQWMASVAYDDNPGDPATLEIFAVAIKNQGLEDETLYLIDNSSDTIVGLTLSERETIGSITMFEVPADWVGNLHVQLFYLCNLGDSHIIIGASDGGSSFTSGYGTCTLKATQYIKIQQAGVNTLVPLV